MNFRALPALLLLSLVSCRTVPETPLLVRKFSSGTLGIVCRGGSLHGSVDRPAAPGPAFVRASHRSLRASISAGISVTDELCNGDPWGAMFLGVPLMLTGAAAPVAGLVGAVATIPGQTPAKVAQELSERLAKASDPDAAAAQLSKAARRAGVPVASARGTSGAWDADAVTADCAGMRRHGATTLAHVTVFGPSLTLKREYSSLTHLEMAMSVSLYDTASGAVRRRFWVRHAVNPGRTLHSWHRQPSTLADAIGEALEGVAAEFAQRLSLEGGKGEVTRSYQASSPAESPGGQ
jgi:hypothetical protein